VNMITENGETHNFRFDVGPVQKPLLAVSGLVDSGWTVVFSRHGSYAQEDRTGEKIRFYRSGGTYKMEGWVQPPGKNNKTVLEPIDDEGFRWQPKA